MKLQRVRAVSGIEGTWECKMQKNLLLNKDVYLVGDETDVSEDEKEEEGEIDPLFANMNSISESACIDLLKTSEISNLNDKVDGKTGESLLHVATRRRKQIFFDFSIFLANRSFLQVNIHVSYMLIYM